MPSAKWKVPSVGQGTSGDAEVTRGTRRKAKMSHWRAEDPTRHLIAIIQVGELGIPYNVILFICCV